MQDMIPDHIKIYCLDELLHIYDKDHQFDMALNQIHELYKFDLKHEYIAKEIELLIKLERLDEARAKAFDVNKNDPNQMEVVLHLLTIYYLQKDFLKASNLDAEYEERFELEDISYQQQVYELFVKVYEALDNKLSHDLYLKKLKKLKKTASKKIDQKTVEKEKKSCHYYRKTRTKTNRN